MITVRDWLVSDLDRITEIEQASFSDPWSRQMIEGVMSAFNFKGLVIEEAGRVEGYVGASYVLDEGEILLVAVDSPKRGKGYGKTLVQSLLDFYEKNGIKKVFLEVRRSNQCAISCYEACGFEKIAERARYYSDGEDAIIMEKKI